jgi:CHC2 zinc finger
VTAVVLRMADRGFGLLPVEKRSKYPLIDKWHERATCDAEGLAHREPRGAVMGAVMTAAMQPAQRDIARMVSIPLVLRQLGWCMGSRSRADCRLLRGRSSETVVYREHVWHCHRCHEGGDVYALVRAVQGCDFRAAMVYVAELAGHAAHKGGLAHDDSRIGVTEGHFGRREIVPLRIAGASADES